MTTTRTTTGLLLAIMLAVVFPPLTHAEGEDGQAIFDKQCLMCHTVGDKSGQLANVGGSLDGVGSKRSAEWLREWIVDPKSKVADTKMPKLPLKDAEVEAVVKYLMTLK